MKREISEKDKVYMKRAIEISEQNLVNGNGGPFGAVIVKDNEVIAASGNRVLADNDPTGHAEIAAIRQACKKLNSFQLDDCDIYCSCEPCPMCLGAIYWARPRKVFFANSREDAADIGFDDNFIYEEVDKDMGERKFPFIQLMRNEAKTAFRKWREMDDKKVY